MDELAIGTIRADAVYRVRWLAAALRGAAAVLDEGGLVNVDAGEAIAQGAAELQRVLAQLRADAGLAE